MTRSNGGPIIVLAYPHAGDWLLTQVLSASPVIACTHTSGLLPLCSAAVSTWEQVEDRGSGPSPLAVKSIRTLVSTIAAAVQASTGAKRWCETAYTRPGAAETFLSIFPETVFLCLHRSLPGLLDESLRRYPWGLGDSPFWRWDSPYPGNNVAMIAAYWVAHTQALLDFEAHHPACSTRIRYEDLMRERSQATASISQFLGLDLTELRAPKLAAAPEPAADGDSAELSHQVNRLPEALRGRVSELDAKLGYHPSRAAS
jgi:Sulfotransferase family